MCYPCLRLVVPSVSGLYKGDRRGISPIDSIRLTGTTAGFEASSWRQRDRHASLSMTWFIDGSGYRQTRLTYSLSCMCRARGPECGLIQPSTKKRASRVLQEALAGSGGPCGIRTRDQRIKSPLLYRTELTAHGGQGRIDRSEDRGEGGSGRPSLPPALSVLCAA